MLFWKTKDRNKGKPRVYYSMRKYKKKGYYDFLTDISEYFTLVQFMYYLGNANHDISVVGYWIFDLNYKIALLLYRYSLDKICAPSVSEEQVAEFEIVFTAVRFICSTSH